MDWRSFRGIPCLSPDGSWDRWALVSPVTLNGIKGYRKWIDGQIHADALSDVVIVIS